MKHYNVVAGVIINDDKVLCLQKGLTRYEYTSYRWEFPGGKIEERETPEHALRRELLEELKINVEIKSHLITVEHKYDDFGITLHAYLCRTSNNDVILTEHVSFKWAELDEIIDLEWCAADVSIAQAVVKELSRC